MLPSLPTAETDLGEHLQLGAMQVDNSGPSTNSRHRIVDVSQMIYVIQVR